MRWFGGFGGVEVVDDGSLSCVGLSVLMCGGCAVLGC